MNTITPVLIDYWHRLPGIPLDVRRRSLDEARARVRAGREHPASLVTFALGDIDEQVVFDATIAYVSAGAKGAHIHEPALGDAIEWVRRSLALNRAAVFAALLSLADPALNERLAPHRLTLTSDEIAIVCRRASGDGRKATREFLRNWIELLAGEEAVPPEAALISAALAATQARAA